MIVLLDEMSLLLLQIVIIKMKNSAYYKLICFNALIIR